MRSNFRNGQVMSPNPRNRYLLAIVLLSTSACLHAQTSSTAKRAAPPASSSEVSYPTRYELASVEDIQDVVDKIYRYVEQTTPVRIVDLETGASVGSIGRLPRNAALERTELLLLTYEWGITYSAMLELAEVTQNVRYRNYTHERLNAITKLAANAKKRPDAIEVAGKQSGRERALSVGSMIAPRSLDDSGSMCAALIKAHRSGVGGDLRPWIDNYVAYVSQRQFRLTDGTLARNRPLPSSLWLDDLYMSVPCLAQAGKLTGDRRYFDDAAKQILQFAERMFVPERALFMHAWVQDMNPHPVFHWARANGWAVMAMVELLEVLPEDHRDRAAILDLFRKHMRGIAAVQGHAGLWHQLLDRANSYEETSASAMFVYGFARGINRGWLDPLAFGPATSLGWNALTTRVNKLGQVEGTCVGTGVGWDPMFYMYRPVDVHAAHGYGPTLLAAAEMIELRRGKGAKAVQNGGLQFGEATSKH